MTKKQLIAELEKAHNLIEGLKSDIECLEKQRTKLVEEKQEILKASLELKRKAKKEADEQKQKESESSPLSLIISF
jgi:hypothetical protein